jgi:RNA polymerase sigma-70 factor, ECF subfamily
VESDGALIERARGGSGDALAALYRRYWPLAWQWAYALTGNRERADDLAQDAFITAVDALPRFDVERPFRPWLKRILLNAGIDEIRRLRRGPVPLDWFADRRRAATEDEHREAGDLVDAVRALKPARRNVIVLHYWLELQVDEIAALLELPYGTVASRLSRGLADVRSALAEQHV